MFTLESRGRLLMWAQRNAVNVCLPTGFACLASRDISSPYVSIEMNASKADQFNQQWIPPDKNSVEKAVSALIGWETSVLFYIFKGEVNPAGIASVWVSCWMLLDVICYFWMKTKLLNGGHTLPSQSEHWLSDDITLKTSSCVPQWRRGRKLEGWQMKGRGGD